MRWNRLEFTGCRPWRAWRIDGDAPDTTQCSAQRGLQGGVRCGAGRTLGVELPEHADRQQGFALRLIEMIVRAFSAEGNQPHRMVGNQQYHHQYHHAAKQSIERIAERR